MLPVDLNTRTLDPRLAAFCGRTATARYPLPGNLFRGRCQGGRTVSQIEKGAITRDVDEAPGCLGKHIQPGQFIVEAGQPTFRRRCKSAVVTLVAKLDDLAER